MWLTFFIRTGKRVLIQGLIYNLIHHLHHLNQVQIYFPFDKSLFERFHMKIYIRSWNLFRTLAWIFFTKASGAAWKGEILYSDWALASHFLFTKGQQKNKIMFDLSEMTISDHVSTEPVSCGKTSGGGGSSVVTISLRNVLMFDVWNIWVMFLLKVYFARYSITYHPLWAVLKKGQRLND